MTIKQEALPGERDRMVDRFERLCVCASKRYAERWWHLRPNGGSLMVEVTQRDRDIAAAFLEEWEPGPEMTVAKLHAVFAHHRHAAMVEGARLMQQTAAETVSNYYNSMEENAGTAIFMLDPAEAIKRLPTLGEQP